MRARCSPTLFDDLLHIHSHGDAYKRSSYSEPVEAHHRSSASNCGCAYISCSICRSFFFRSYSCFSFSVALVTIICFSRLKSCSVCNRRREHGRQRGRQEYVRAGEKREKHRHARARRKPRRLHSGTTTHLRPDLVRLLLGLEFDEVHHLADLPRSVLVSLWDTVQEAHQ